MPKQHTSNPVGRPTRGKAARVSINARVEPETKEYLISMGQIGVSIDEVVRVHREGFF